MTGLAQELGSDDGESDGDGEGEGESDGDAEGEGEGEGESDGDGDGESAGDADAMPNSDLTFAVGTFNPSSDIDAAGVAILTGDAAAAGANASRPPTVTTAVSIAADLKCLLRTRAGARPKAALPAAPI
jgi:hypothetical protein